VLLCSADNCFVIAVVSLPVVAAAFYGIRLQGSFVLFWLVYYMTLCVGIGECQLSLHKSQ
jgi:uncharacterized membrane-anchored protein